MAHPFRVAFCLFILTLAIFLPTSSTSTTSTDAVGAELISWRIATTGTPWFDSVDLERANLSDATNPLGTSISRNDHAVFTRSPGVAALSVPAYWVTQPSTDIKNFTLHPGAYSAAIATALAVALLFIALSKSLRLRAALPVSLAFAVATPIWSVAATSPWTHTVTVLGITGMAAAAAHEKWWLVGLMGGVAGWGRIHTLVIVAVLGLLVAMARRDPRLLAVVGSSSAATMLLASVWTHWMYGTWIPSGGYNTPGYLDRAAEESTIVSSVESQLGMWVSPDRGILVWTPVLLVLAPAVVRAWGELPMWSRALPVGGLIYTVIQAQVSYFAGGDAFYGYRHGLEFLACIAPCLALSAHRMDKPARLLVGPVLGLQFTAIFVGAVSEGYLLGLDDVWRDNSFLAAVRVTPALLAIAALVMLVFALVARILDNRWRLAEASYATSS